MDRPCKRRLSFTPESQPQKRFLITVNTPTEWKVRGNKIVFVVSEADCDKSWVSFYKEKSRRVVYPKLGEIQDCSDQYHRIFVTDTKRFFKVTSSIAKTLNLHSSTVPGHFHVEISKVTKATVRTPTPSPLVSAECESTANVTANAEPVASTSTSTTKTGTTTASKIVADNSAASAISDALLIARPYVALTRWYVTPSQTMIKAEPPNSNFDSSLAAAGNTSPSSSDTSDYRVIKVRVPSPPMNEVVGQPDPQPQMNELGPQNFAMYRDNFCRYMNDHMLRLIKMELEAATRGDNWTLLASACPHTWALLQYAFQLNIGPANPLN